MRCLWILILTLLFGAPSWSPAGPRSEPFRVAVVLSDEREEYRVALNELKRVLDARITEHSFHGDAKRIPVVIDTLRKESPDLVVAFGSAAFKTLKGRLGDIPVMFSMVVWPRVYCKKDEVPFGVSLLADPEDEAAFLLELLGRGARVGIIHKPAYSGTHVEALALAGKARGLKMRIEAASRDTVYKAIDRIKNDVDAIFLLPDPIIAKGKALDYLRLECFRRRIPIVACSRSYLDRDCVASVMPDYGAIGRLVGEKAEAFLVTGVPLGVLHARKVQIGIHQGVAKRLSLKIPESIRKRAVMQENK